jgi:hypothetical protein
LTGDKIQALFVYEKYLDSYCLDLFQLFFFLGDGCNGGFLLVLKHARSSGLLNHGECLSWLHVKHLGDSPLHDEEVRVVDIELHGLKEVRDNFLGHIVAVDEELVLSTENNLTKKKRKKEREKERKG